MHTDTSPSPSSAGLTRWRALFAHDRRSNLLWLAVWALAVSAALVLSALAVALYFPSSPATARFTANSVGHAGNELLYRACVREARMKSLPVKPYPQESENVSFAHEGKQLLKRTETLEADVNDMSVENGCQVTLQPSVRVEVAPSADSSDRMRKMTQEQDGRKPPLHVSLEEVPLAAASNREAPSCTLTRDMALQSHFMLLNLCTIERAPAGEHRPADTRKKSGRVILRPTT